MSKNPKETNLNLYYISKDGKIEQVGEREKRETNLKVKEREKRIKQNKSKKENLENNFDFDTETVIGMTNKNNEKKEYEFRREEIKKQRKVERKRKKLKTLLKWTGLTAIIAGGFAFATCSPIFNVKSIEVINNSQVSSDTVISLSGLTIDQNLFSFNKWKLEEQIKENAYIQNVIIHRVFPNKIKIEIEERTKKFSLGFLNSYAYINSQGYILEIAEDNLNLPILQGQVTPEERIVVGTRLELDDLERLEVSIKIMDVCKDNQIDNKVTSIDISDKSDYIVYMEEEEKKVHLGNGTNLSNRILYVLTMLEKEKGKKGDCFVNGEINNKFQPFFREKV